MSGENLGMRREELKMQASDSQKETAAFAPWNGLSECLSQLS
jgi:hypothetical protein